MSKRWTKKEDERLMQIIDLSSVRYNWWAAELELKRSAAACKRRYWELRDREFLKGK